MAKAKNRPTPPSRPSPPPPVAAPPVAAASNPPSGDDLPKFPFSPEDVNTLLLLVDQIESETGSPPGAGIPDPEAVLSKVLARATGALSEAQSSREKAKAAEVELQKAVKAAEDQRRDQEARFAQVRKELEAKDKQLDADRRRLDDAQKKVEAQLEERKQGLDTRESSLLEKADALREREANAEAGFLVHRRKIVEEVEAQLEQIRQQRDAALSQLERMRADEEAACRKRAEDRAARERTEDEARANAADAARRRLTEELDRVREARLAEVAKAVADAKAAADTERARDAKDHALNLAALRAEVENKRLELVQMQRDLNAQRNKLQAEQELLAEDKAALDAKVARFAAARVADLEADIVALTEQRDAAVRQRDAYFGTLEAHRDVERRLGDRRPEDLLAQLTELERKNAQLHAELGKRMSGEAELRLEQLERDSSEWQEERVVLTQKLREAETRIGRLRQSAVELETLRGEKEALETNKKLMDAALKELQAEVEKYTQADEKRNPMEALLALDRDEVLNAEVRTFRPLGGATPTLKDFTDDLRHRIAKGVEGRTLYYSERDVRCFLGGIAMSRLLLLQGISGTGKTSLPLAFAGAIGAGAEVVEVQAGWRDRQDLIGYFNAFHRHYYATNFLQALYRAGTPRYADRPFLIILDEINLSRVEQFFADFLSALELHPSKRRLTLLNDPASQPARLMVEGRHLPIPPNVWFVGTANHDETTTEFADKTYDRAHVMELPRRDPKADWFDVKPRNSREAISFKALEETFDEAVRRRDADVQRVHGWLRDERGIAGFLDRRFRIGWGNRLEDQAKRFVPVVVEAGGSVGEAVDHLLHTRVLRKLRDRHDVRPKALEEFRVLLEKQWEGLDKDNRPVRSLQLIDRELRAKKDEDAG